MRPSKPSHAKPARAPHSVGALLLLAAALLLGACNEKKDEAAAWNDGGKTPAEAEPAPVPPPPPGSNAQPASVATKETVPAAPDTPAASPASNTLRFLSYNLKNYLTMTRYADGDRQDVFKPEEAISAVVRLIVSAEPDVVGICEIGTTDDLGDLQKRLAAAGLDLPHREHAGGADQDRFLALLSRYPIVATDSQGAGGSLTYKSVDLNNDPQIFAMQRGILDATVEVGDRQVRFLGVHLKSKREVPEGHQDLMRRNEAWLLRKHADAILAGAPDTLLCVYGDLNDTRRETPVRSVAGAYESETYLEPLSHKDSRGEVWTHFWEYQHVYSRFDYVLASRALRSFFDEKNSRIIDDPQWSVASDHRPLLTLFAW